MRVIITNKQEITAKNGKEYISLKGVSQSGETVDLFLDVNQAHQMEVRNVVPMSQDDLESLFANAAEVWEVSFNQRGRVDSMKKES